MHIQTIFRSMWTLFLLADISYAFVGPTCTKMKDVLGDKPDRVFELFKSQICDKGCKPVIAHYDKWAKKNAVLPAINMVMKDMGMPQHEKAIVGLAEHVVKEIKSTCAKDLGKKHLCSDPETLKKFGDCLKGCLMPVVMAHVGELMPLVAEPMCKKEFAYLQKDDLWNKTIPSFMGKYAKACRKL